MQITFRLFRGSLKYVLLLGGYYVFYREGPKRTNRGVAERIKAGSNPKESQRSLECTVNRSGVVKSIQKLLFESDADNGRISVILGPAGCGKTRAVIEACSVAPGPNYILYQEIYQTSETAKQLAHAANIPLSRTTFDYMYRFLGFESLFYFPSNPVEAVTYVMNKVANRAMEIIEKDDLKQLPCFVIDATELLAEYEPDILNTLLRLAQYYVRTKKLRIVLVDSDGITLCKMKKTLKHPIFDIVEVGDLEEQEAVQYLIERTKMSNDLAKCLVGLIGGRLLHLSYAVDVFKDLESGIREDMVYDRIKEHLFAKIIASMDNSIIHNAPVSKEILEYFCDNSKPLFPSAIKRYFVSRTNHNPTEIQTGIDDLVYANILRYNADGELMWHSRLAEVEITARHVQG